MKWRDFGFESPSGLHWMNWYEPLNHPMDQFLNCQSIGFTTSTNPDRVWVSCYRFRSHEWVGNVATRNPTHELTRTYTRIHTHHIYTRTHACTQAYVHTYTYSYTLIYIYIYISYIYVYIYSYTNTLIHTYTQTHAPTSKHMHANVPIFTHTPTHNNSCIHSNIHIY